MVHDVSKYNHFFFGFFLFEMDSESISSVPSSPSVILASACLIDDLVVYSRCRGYYKGGHRSSAAIRNKC
jgi:hypothetical protein